MEKEDFSMFHSNRRFILLTGLLLFVLQQHWPPGSQEPVEVTRVVEVLVRLLR